MIKMFIGNEEVVSDHEFTIKEEMLSASSTILNNCYPRSWELEKDYVSNFYYPKDYSKFVLANGEFEHGNTEYSVLEASGEQLEFNTNIEKEWNNFNIYGNTEQATRSGKNMLKIYASGSGSSNGINYTINSDGSITLSGTATSTFYLNLNNYTGYFGHFTYNEIYTSYLKNAGNYVRMATRYNASSTQVNLYTTFGNECEAHTYTGTTNADCFTYLTIANGTAITGIITVYPMIVKGDYTMETIGEYEPYGVMPSPDYPSELNSVGYKNLWNEQWENGYYNRNTGAKGSSNRYIRCVDYIPIEPNTTIYFNKPDDFSDYSVIFYNSSHTKIGGTAPTYTSDHVYTVPSDASYFTFYGYVGIEGATYQNNVLITKGDTPHSYIPHGKYGIEVKTTGKNIIDFNIISYYGTANSATTSRNNGEYTVTNGSNSWGACRFNQADMNLEPNTTYTFSALVKSTTTTNGSFVFVYGGMTNTGSTVQGNTATAGQRSYATFTTPSAFSGGTQSIGILTSEANKTTVFADIMIEKNNQATTYEAYQSNTYLYTLDNPLRSIGNTKDLLTIKNGMICVDRKIGSIILDGSEDWRNYVIGDIENGTSIRLSYNASTNIKSNYFKTLDVDDIDSSSLNFISYDNGYIILNIANSSLSSATLASFKSWLSTHNTEAQYILAEPYTEEVGQVKIPYSFEGVNNVTLYTGLTITTIDVYYYWKNYNVIFAGIVKNSGDISLNPRFPHYCSLQILDYKTFLSESDTLDYVISNKTIKEAIEMVVDTVSDYGFSVGTIDISSADDIIGAYSTLNKTAYDVLQYLADISGSKWRARYLDSDTMAIDFYEPDTLPQAEDIEYTQEYWEDNSIVDLTFNYGTRDYRNKQIVLSDEVYAGIDYNEIILSNGYNTNFIASQNVGIVKEITVNGVKKDVISQAERELGADADFYYTPGKNIIESSSSYTAGTQIAVIYTPLVKGRQIVFNNDEVGRIATQTNTIGVISRYESRNDVVSSAELERIGETYIEYKGKAEIILKLTTQNKDLFNIGEVAYFNSTIDELKQKYMVKSKETQYIIESETGTINLFYVYELTSSFNSEKAINYFDNQRNKAQGNIQEGESITRNIDINNSAVIIWGNSSIEETSISVVGDNVLNSVLNSPFIE